MATTPDLQEPFIAAARAQAWHHTGDALLTLEAARTWVEGCGLLLFAPRASTLGAPAPSLVEATLGEAKGTTTLAETEVARTLVARMVGEGSAIPLNLLGGPGDLPDFLVSAQAFPFVFTLRGDKGWKRPPETSGSVKVTPLGLRIYELLAEKGAMTVGEIVTEVGREITESAVTRALGELWQILRVIPVLQQGEGDTRWELITSRFLKAVKAGANAGQPTALSGLVSLYLQQSLVATEEEIAAFLSPLTARSRVRDVVHGLSAGRQLAEGVVNGKTVLYVPEMLPDFAEFAPSSGESESEADLAETGEGSAEAADTTQEAPAAPRERIQSFEREGGRPQGNFRGKPVSRGKGAGGFRDSGRPPRPGSDRGPRPDRGAPRSGGSAERRPFTPRDGAPSGGRDAGRKSFGAGRPGGDRPSFSRPWDEERGSRPPREGASSAAPQDRASRPPREDRGGRPERPFRSNDERPPRRFDDRGPRPPFRREGGSGGASGASDRGFAPRGDRPQRPFRDRPAGDKPFRPREDRGDRPFRPREGGGDRPFTPRPGGGDRPFRPRPEGGDRPLQPRVGGGDRPFRPKEGGDRPFRPRTESGDRPFRPRPEGSNRPFQPRSGGSADRPFRPRPAGEGPGRSSGGSDRPRGDRPFQPRAGGGDRREGGRPPFGNRAGGGRPSFGARPQGAGGFRPSGRPGGKAPNRPDRAPRKPRPEDEA